LAKHNKQVITSTICYVNSTSTFIWNGTKSKKKSTAPRLTDESDSNNVEKLEEQRRRRIQASTPAPAPPQAPAARLLTPAPPRLLRPPSKSPRLSEPPLPQPHTSPDSTPPPPSKKKCTRAPCADVRRPAKLCRKSAAEEAHNGYTVEAGKTAATDSCAIATKLAVMAPLSTHYFSPFSPFYYAHFFLLFLYGLHAFPAIPGLCQWLCVS
jgi:hypothetical protein